MLRSTPGHDNEYLKGIKQRFVPIYAYTQGGKGHWAVYYTSPQSFLIPFFYSRAQNFDDFH